MARYGRDSERDRWQREQGGGGGYGGSGRGEEHGGQWGGGYGHPREGQGNWGAGRSDYAGGYGEDFGERGGWSAGRGGDVYGGGYGYEGGGYGERDYPSGYGRGGPGYTGGEWSGERGSQGRSGQDELRRLRAADIMTENPETVTPDTSLAEAAQKMRDLNVGIIPVVESAENRRLRGVVTDRDIAIRAVADGMDARGTTVSVVMTTEVEVCNKNDSVGDVLRVMEREQVRRVPITDRDGRLVGIVAQADVARDVDSHRGEHRVAHTLERISEPARSGREAQRASQSRGDTGEGGGLQASSGSGSGNEEGANGGNQNA